MTVQLNSPSQPVLSNRFGRLVGKEAWNENLRLASLAEAKIASCLGPKGAYKLVTYHRGPEMVTKVTKDAVDIVDELGVEYPAIKTIAEAAKIQRQYVGDGVSTLIVLVSAFLSEASKLIEEGLHPNMILDGYEEATKKSMSIIDEIAGNSAGDLDERLLEGVDCGRGLLTRKLQTELSEAVRRIAEGDVIDVRKIGIVKKPGESTNDSRLVRGVIIKKGKAHPNMPDWVEAPKVGLVTKKLEVKPLESDMKGEGPFHVKLNITQSEQLQKFKNEESRLRSHFADTVRAVGADLLISRSKIDEKISDQLSRAGIFAIQLADQKELDATAEATGARLVGDIDELEKEYLGTAKRLEVEKLGPDHIAILECDRGATFLLRGSSPELLQELEKIIKNALLILKHSRSNSKIIPGGGAIYVDLALRLRKLALSFPGREQLAINSFAKALEKIPEQLSINYGLDPIDIMTQLRNHHKNGEQEIGVSEHGCDNMYEANLVELASVNKATIRRALEVTSLLLRIDECFYIKERPIFHKQ